MEDLAMTIRIKPGPLGSGALAFGALLATATPLHAAVVSSGYIIEAPPQRAVSVKDLDLKRPADVATFYARIRKAAQEVCGGDPVTGSRLNSIEQQECIARAMDATVAAVNRAELSAYHHQGKATGERTRGAGS
jgi:UrcA family protein